MELAFYQYQDLCIDFIFRLLVEHFFFAITYDSELFHIFPCAILQNRFVVDIFILFASPMFIRSKKTGTQSPILTEVRNQTNKIDINKT